MATVTMHINATSLAFWTSSAISTNFEDTRRRFARKYDHLCTLVRDYPQSTPPDYVSGGKRAVVEIQSVASNTLPHNPSFAFATVRLAGFRVASAARAQPALLRFAQIVY